MNPNIFNTYTHSRIKYYDALARRADSTPGLGRYYRRRVIEIYRQLVGEGLRVIELGSAQGELLSALKPSYGVGVDFSEEMVKRARASYPHINFICSDAHFLNIEEKFDVVILSDLLHDLWDVEAVFNQISRLTAPHTRIMINVYSRLWEMPLKLASALGLTHPRIEQNWLTVEDISNMLYLQDFELIARRREILWPMPGLLISSLLNRGLVKTWPISEFALSNFIVCRPMPEKIDVQPVVSVVVPARNEAGNIASIFERTPQMGKSTELIFVEGHSTDNTYEVITDEILKHPDVNASVYRQSGKGKGDAVRLGFERAAGDVLMILDADMTVAPEDLPRFYHAIYTGKGEFINGVRLVYSMEDNAMRFFNQIGNKFFSLAFSWLLGQPIKDTLCGTKVIRKKDYEKIALNRPYFGDFDPFGDFDMLFGAAKLNLKIVEMPIRYRQRTYGTTNIQRWRHGWMLLKMVLFAASRIKFV
ncbi:glycosyltransferase [Candidatus Magnetominusculus xianensis]|uniref:Glycosyl transferase n=1 Tax=Candidatus Magnetominusculus xianensis TaxID=1748249 RepID=A0ABR5SJV0_9BACT|nr:glycosyltransferase [Candidatus Magnetominusculus xianensis]KWT95093.1 glycosyl transferase [Candidatus Magnetominusculus xianensis]